MSLEDSEIAATDESDSPAVALLRNDEAERLRLRVQVLNPIARRLLVRMFGLDGFEATETLAGTADFFGMSLAECKTAIQNAMDQLRSSFVEEMGHADVA